MKVIARVSKFVVGVVATLALAPTLLRAIISPNSITIGWVIIGAMIVIRVAQISVAVSPDWVIVRNFFRTTHVPVWEAEVEFGETESERGLMSDAGGKFDEGGRMLYVRRQWNGDRLHIGVAPRYGSEPTRIHDELVDAIREARAA